MRFADQLKLGYELRWSQAPRKLRVSKEELKTIEQEEKVKEEEYARKITKIYSSLKFGKNY